MGAGHRLLGAGPVLGNTGQRDPRRRSWDQAPGVQPALWKMGEEQTCTSGGECCLSAPALEESFSLKEELLQH